MIDDRERRETVWNLGYRSEMCHGTGVPDSDVLNALDIGCGGTIEILEDR